MKQLTKEQLMELVYDNCEKATEENMEYKAKNMENLAKNADSLGASIADVIVAYGEEIKKECCHTFVKTIYDILYGE